MMLKQPVVLAVAGLLMFVSLAACSKDGKEEKSAEAGADAITSTAVGTEAVKGIAGMNNERKQVSYMIGMDIAKSLKEIEKEIDISMVSKGLADQMAGKSLINEVQHKEIQTAFTAKLQAHAEKVAAELPAKNKAAGQAFLAKNKSATGVITTASGLQYQVLRAGPGAKPGATDMVKVNYKGTLLDGTVFDSSYDRNKPIDFPLNQVIPGWSEGVGLMTVGSKYKFWIPSELAYGEAGPQGIGPNATLVFEVELLDTKPAAE